MLKAGNVGPVYYSKSDFGDQVSLDGLSCDREEGCPIAAMPNAEGGISASAEALPAFKNVWIETHPDYDSPYSGSGQRRLSEGNTTDGR